MGHRHRPIVLHSAYYLVINDFVQRADAIHGASTY